MSNTRSRKGNPESDVLDLVPEAILPPKARKKAQAIAQAFDSLMFLDQNGELSLDRSALIALVGDKSLVPAELQSIALLETVKHVGRRVKEAGNGLRISWSEAALHGLPIKPLGVSEVQALGLRKDMTVPEVEAFLEKQLGEIPDAFKQSPGESNRSKFVEMFKKNRTVWDCLVTNLGWWAAIAILGSLITFLAFVAEVGWQIALVLAIIWFGVTTAGFVVQCLLDPFWHF